jgi:hypothetical protein
MDPASIMFVVLVVMGGWHAMKGGGRAATARRTANRKAATARGGTRNQAGTRRRAARQADLGYWGREIRLGFPEIRHGFAQGWREHQIALAQRDTDADAHRADNAHLLARLAAERAAHRHRMEIAQRRAAQPTMSDQLRAVPPQTYRQPLGDPIGDEHVGAPGKECTNPKCSCHDDHNGLDPQTRDLLDRQAREAQQRMQKIIDDGPNMEHRPPGTPPGAPQAGRTGTPVTDWGPGNIGTIGPVMPPDDMHPVGSGAPGPQPLGGAPVTDFNLDQILSTASSAQDLADHAVNEELLDRVVTMSDEIGAVVPTDATANGHAGEAAAATSKIKEGFGELTEASRALHDHMDKTYTAQQDALDASGEEQPKEGLLQH